MTASSLAWRGPSFQVPWLILGHSGSEKDVRSAWLDLCRTMSSCPKPKFYVGEIMSRSYYQGGAMLVR